MSTNPLIDARLSAVEAAYPGVLSAVKSGLYQQDPIGVREQAVDAMRAAGFGKTPLRGRGIYLHADRLIERARTEARS